MKHRVLRISRRATGGHPLYFSGQTQQQVACFLARHRGGAGDNGALLVTDSIGMVLLRTTWSERIHVSPRWGRPGIPVKQVMMMMT
jgi:hypothetical protein